MKKKKNKKRSKFHTKERIPIFFVVVWLNAWQIFKKKQQRPQKQINKRILGVLLEREKLKTIHFNEHLKCSIPGQANEISAFDAINLTYKMLSNKYIRLVTVWKMKFARCVCPPNAGNTNTNKRHICKFTLQYFNGN